MAKPPSYSPAKAEAILRQFLWPKGMKCPYCRQSDPERFGPCGSRKDLHRCLDCMRQFRWTQGTILEKSPLPADIWLLAIWHVANERGISGLRLSQLTDVSAKTGKILLDRITAAAQAAKFQDRAMDPNDKALALAEAVMRARKPAVRRVLQRIKSE